MAEATKAGIGTDRRPAPALRGRRCVVVDHHSSSQALEAAMDRAEGPTP